MWGGNWEVIWGLISQLLCTSPLENELASCVHPCKYWLIRPMSSNLKMCSRFFSFTFLFSEICLQIAFYKYQKWVLITLRGWEHWDWVIGLYKGDVCGQERDREREGEKQKQREVKDGYWNIQTDQELSQRKVMLSSKWSSQIWTSQHPQASPIQWECKWGEDWLQMWLSVLYLSDTRCFERGELKYKMGWESLLK